MAMFGPLNPVELARASRRVAATAVRRLRPDHGSIVARSVQFPGTSMLRFYLYIAVAPSRSAPRAFDDGQVRRAAAFALDAFDDVFGDVPTTADREATVFTVTGDGGAHERALYVHRSGLVELLWALRTEQPESADGLLLDVEEMAAVVARLAGTVAHRPYAQLSNAGRGRRRFARVDWWFNLTADISHTDGSRAWTGLRFTGATPPRARQ
jgi:hypothetical protein